MTARSTDLLDARQQPRRRSTQMGEAERRTRAAVTERKLPQVPAGAVPGLSQSPDLLNEDQRRRRASYSLPASVIRQKAVDALRAEISPEINDVARRCRLNLLATRALQVIHTAQKAAGDQFVPMPRSRIAEAIGVEPERALQLLDGLRQIGAIECRLGLAGEQPRYRITP